MLSLMSERAKTIKYSAYYIILLSYLAFMLVYIFFGVVLVRQSNAALITEITAANHASMYQMRNIVDNGFRDVMRICIEQSFDTTISNLVNRQGRSHVDARHRITYLDAINSLQRANVANNFIDIFYLMLFHDEIVLTQNGKYSTIQEFTARYQIDHQSFIDFNHQTQHTQYTSIISDNGNYIFFSYAMPLYTRDKSATLEVRINNDLLWSIFEGSKWLPESQVVLLNSNNEYVLASDSDNISLAVDLIPWDEIEEGSNFHISVGQLEYTVMLSRSEVSPFLYGIIIPRSAYLSTQRALMRTYIIALVIIFFVGLTMSVAMAYAQYSPIRRLADSFKGTVPAVNEYSFIMSGISNIKSENELLIQTNKEQQDILRMQELRNVLLGMPANEYELGGLLRECGMPLQYSRYCFILFSNKNAEDNLNVEKLIGIITGNIDAVWIDMGAFRCLFLDLPKDITEENIYQICKSWSDSSGNKSYFISIGKAFLKLDEIHQEYIAVAEIHEFQLSESNEYVMSSDTMPEIINPSQESEADKISKETIVMESVAFIQERYADPMLSVASVADEFGISNVTLTRAFKRILNIGVLDFIHKTRLDVAKQLIHKTDANLLDIAQQVGYVSNATFIRVFKKHVKLTPSQYRSLNYGK